MGPKSGWGGVQIGYVRPVQFLDHLTVIKTIDDFNTLTRPEPPRLQTFFNTRSNPPDVEKTLHIGPWSEITPKMRKMLDIAKVRLSNI